MDPRFDHLKNTGAVPDSGELQSLLAQKVECKEKCKELLKQLDDLALQDQVQDKAIRAELMATKANIGYYQSFTSALRKIPPEVLSNIFLMAVPAIPTITGLKLTLAPPWTLVLVCKCWRDVWLANPTLWSNIYLDCSFTALKLPNFVRFREGGSRVYSASAGEYAGLVPDRTIQRAVSLLEVQLNRLKEVNIYVTITPCQRLDYAQPHWRILLLHMRCCASLRAPYHVVLHTPFGTLH
ncbi:hypothetical protein BDV98DRAFT_633172 [Pterulicium gracile]|uniref:Uncharacterized protein n=1 Tax=Pterulicium gracile TaxID=1884261 RepID=A0A5C3Q811_9AGAR|nr:hypothetical protein BDV98DRAFT_633172 [Pterula gracilis]